MGINRDGGQSAPKVIVGTGWWCDVAPHDWAIGAAQTRSSAFFETWYEQVVNCFNPTRIVVTDSASPLKPNCRSKHLVEWIVLDQNYGHPNDIRVGKLCTKYSGFTRSVINGAMYALCCDCDFYVYVEQDCLVYGDNLLTHAIGDSMSDILLGQVTENGRGINGMVAAPMLQQSLMIVRRVALERFLDGVLGAPWTDGERSPEEIMAARLKPFDWIRIPFGRSRPLDFLQSHFYAQHLSQQELAQFLQLCQRQI